MVKSLIFLLVLANLLFYAYSGGYFGSGNPDADRLSQQINPEKMRIVSRDEAPALPSAALVPPQSLPPSAAGAESEAGKEAPTPTDPVNNDNETPPAVAEPAAGTTPVCLLWRQLTPADADRLAGMLAKRFADYKQFRRTVVAESNGWWVHLPALPSKADAERKAAELREMGVADFFIVQDGQNRNAISLGVFSSESRGKDRLAEVKAKGVRSAVLAPRPGKDDTVTLQARGPATARSAVIGAASEVLPKTEAQTCK